MEKNSKHRIRKSIVRIVYMIIIVYYTYTSSCTVRELICISAIYNILFAPVSDWMIDWFFDN